MRLWYPIVHYGILKDIMEVDGSMISWYDIGEWGIIVLDSMAICGFL